MSQSTAPNQPSLVQVALWVLYRYRMWLAVWCAIAAVLAFVAGRKMGKETWRVNATLSYLQKPVHDGQRLIYQPPNHPTMAELLRSMEYLDAAAERADLPMPTALLSTILEIQLPPNSELLLIFLNWSNPSDAEKFIDALMQVAIEKRQAVRDRMIADAERLSQEQIKSAQAKLDNLERALRQQFPTEPGSTPAQELARVIVNIQTAELEVRTTQANLNRNTLRSKQIEEEFAPLLAKKEGIIVDQMTEAANERRVQQLRQQSLDDAEIARLQLELKTARADLDTNTKLAKIGAVSRIELNRSRNAVEIFDLQLRKAREVRSQLDSLEKTLKGDGPNPVSKMSLIEQEYRVRRSGVRIEEVSLTEDLKVQQTQLARLKELRDELVARSKLAEPLQRQIDNAKTQVEQLRAFSQNLAAQMQPDQRELSIAAMASSGWMPFSTSFRKWTIAFFLLSVGSFVAGLVVWEMLKVYRGFEGLALRLGLPILARFGPMPLRDGPELAARLLETRRLALRLCQVLPEPGSVVLLASPMRGAQIDHFTAEMSRCLAHHEERILVLDMRINGQAQNPGGIVQQSYTDNLPARLSPTSLLETGPQGMPTISHVRSTQLHSVDYLPIGSPDRLAGVMAMTRLRQAVAEMKELYTLVFMIAPPLTGDIDTEILGAFAQGVLLVTDENPNTGVMTRTVNGLRSAQIPIIGAVVYPADEPQIPALVVAQ